MLAVVSTLATRIMETSESIENTETLKVGVFYFFGCGGGGWGGLKSIKVQVMEGSVQKQAWRILCA
jgi:hypothetical protein